MKKEKGKEEEEEEEEEEDDRGNSFGGACAEHDLQQPGIQTAESAVCAQSRLPWPGIPLEKAISRMSTLAAETVVSLSLSFSYRVDDVGKLGRGRDDSCAMDKVGDSRCGGGGGGGGDGRRR